MTKLNLLALTFVFVASCFSPQADAQDWNQWLGEKRDSHWNEKNIIEKFPKGGPKVLWRQKIANGYSGPAVAGDRVFVADFVRSAGDDRPNPGKKNDLTGKERIICLDRKTGKPLWKHQYDCKYKLSYPNGPRATPTVDGDRVYTLGAEGHLFCLNAKDGNPIWSKDLKKEYNMDSAPFWGFAAHPLVHGDMLYCVVGGSGSIAVAFDKKSGKEIWKALSAKTPGYCPPTIIKAGGVEQLLIWHPESLNGLDPKSGKVYWSVAMKPAYDMSIVAPIKYGDYLYATALQGTSVLLKLDSSKPAVTEVWRGKGPHPDHNPPLIVDDHIYGVDVRGHLRCFDLKTGKKKWESLATAPNGRPAGSTTGFIVKNNDQYFIATEQGELIIAKLSPEGFKEMDRAKILEPTSRTSNRKVVWSHPAFAHGCIFARNDKEIVCISLKK